MHKLNGTNFVVKLQIMAAMMTGWKHALALEHAHDEKVEQCPLVIQADGDLAIDQSSC